MPLVCVNRTCILCVWHILNFEERLFFISFSFPFLYTIILYHHQPNDNACTLVCLSWPPDPLISWGRETDNAHTTSAKLEGPETDLMNSLHIQVQAPVKQTM